MPRIAKSPSGETIQAQRRCVSLDAETIRKVQEIVSTVPGVGGFSGALRWAVAKAHADAARKTLAEARRRVAIAEAMAQAASDSRKRKPRR